MKKKHWAARWFQNRSLCGKFVLILGLLLSLLLAGEFASRSMAYRAYNEQLYVMTSKTLNSYVERVETQLERMDELTLSIIGDRSIQEELVKLKDTPTGTMPWLVSCMNLRNGLAAHLYDDMNLNKMHISVREDTNTSTTSSTVFLEQKDRLNDLAIEAKGAMCFAVDAGKLFMTREIRQWEGLTLEHLGTIIAQVDMEGLIRRCMGGESDLSAAVWVEGECLYDGTGLGLSAPGQTGWRIEGNRFIVEKESRRGWRFLAAMPYGRIQRSIDQAARRSVALTVLAGVIGLIVSALLVRGIARHLERLLDKFDAYQHGELPDLKKSEQYVGRRDEIGRLHRHFDRMAYEHKRLTDENYERMVLLKEAQYGQLQQQIRPHFLFNALSTIVWVAYEHGDEETARMTETLARILRASINRGETTVTLRDELKLTGDYMEIQRARFGRRLEYACEVPEELMEIALPRMTVQPIVENAVHYAAEEMLDTCRIRVFARREGKDVVIVVEDNGSGIDEDILNRLENGAAQSRGTGIGLRNIDQRIRIAFSERYGLEFHRVDDRTQVWIRVPEKIEKGTGGLACIR